MAIIVSKVSIDIKCLRRLKAKIMKKSILNLKGVQKLSLVAQKAINGGANGCWLQACGITREQCMDEFQGIYNKSTGCCGYVPSYC